MKSEQWSDYMSLVMIYYNPLYTPNICIGCYSARSTTVTATASMRKRTRLVIYNYPVVTTKFNIPLDLITTKQQA